MRRGPGLAWLLAALWLSGCASGKSETVSDHEGQTTADPADSAAGTTAARQVVLAPEAVSQADIRVGTAGPATIAVTVDVPAEVKLDGDHVLVLHPRFAGVVREMRKAIGDDVQQGETVATVQSNESLTDYAIPTTMGGRVMERGATAGQAVTPDVSLYTIADLSRVWVELAVYPNLLGVIRRGQEVRVHANGADLQATGTISYLGSVLAEDAHASVARVVLPNPQRRWEPGLFVTATVVTDRARVPIAVPDEAVVRLADGAGVFVASGTRFTMREVRIGRSDGVTTEIVSGLAAGDSVAVKNAFVLKAELEKSELEE